MRRPRAYFMLPLASALLLLLSSCADLGYYAQCVTGHLGVMSKGRPIAEILEDPETPAPLRSQLTTVLDIREFASSDLHLPDNASYRSYADLGRPYVVWNVVATPEFSLTPLQWCFPVAGCVSYRGYFSEEEAEEFAADLTEEGYDVYLYGVPAYSTLNWFDDPVLSTFSDQPTPHLAGLIFHELAHQVLYVENDSSFNEAFAKTLELEGVRRWLEIRGADGDETRYMEAFEREEDFVELVEGAREELARLYERDLDPADMREEKKDAFARLLRDYAKLKEDWGGYAGFDQWFEEGPNNSKCASVSTYRTLVPAFQEVLRRAKGDLKTFFSEAERISQLQPSERFRVLEYIIATRAHPPSGS